jgi:hypothetical protein
LRRLGSVAMMALSTVQMRMPIRRLSPDAHLACRLIPDALHWARWLASHHTRCSRPERNRDRRPMTSNARRSARALSDGPFGYGACCGERGFGPHCSRGRLPVERSHPIHSEIAISG